MLPFLDISRLPIPIVKTCLSPRSLSRSMPALSFAECGHSGKQRSIQSLPCHTVGLQSRIRKQLVCMQVNQKLSPDHRVLPCRSAAEQVTKKQGPAPSATEQKVTNKPRSSTHRFWSA